MYKNDIIININNGNYFNTLLNLNNKLNLNLIQNFNDNNIYINYILWFIEYIIFK